MKLVTAAQMREIDRMAVEHYGLPSLVLMENAGAAVARETEALLGGLAERRICICAGRGNNGGDGFVAARHLMNGGAKVKVFLLGEKTGLQGDGLIYANVLTRMGVDILEVGNERDWDKARVAAAFSECVIDALVGTGYKGEASNQLTLVIDLINKSGKKVVSVDVPSGICADTGQVKGIAVKASVTVTFGQPKPGLVLYPGTAYAGKVMVDAIGMPEPLLYTTSVQQQLITAAHVRQLLPVRRGDAHKGSNGHAGIIAGSQGYTGAAALCATAALRTGAGLVTLAAGTSLRGVLEVKLTEAMVRTLPEIGGGAIGMKAVPFVEELSAHWDVIAIGPGSGRHNETQAAIRGIIANADKPLVIDADGIQAIAGHMDVISQCEALAILTPHPGEMSALTGLTPNQINQNRIEVARQTAQQWNSIFVLKGAPTVVAYPDGAVYVNSTGNAGLATGGTGDVLTGIIAALIAQGLSSHDAAVAGVYLHGLAADIIAKSGMIGMTAGDIVTALPAALAGLAKE